MNEEPKLQILRDFEAPPGGWRYTVPETGVTLTAKFFGELWPQIVRHLRANGHPEPDKDEIMDAVCRETRPPGGKCAPVPPKPVAGRLPVLTLAMAERFLRSIWNTILDRKIVSREEAERRYKICTEDCPLAIGVGGCWSGCNAIAKMADKLWAKNPLPEIPEKRVCAACGCLTRYKTWIPNATLDKAETEKPLYWEKCWRHQPDPSEDTP